jgi:hypothetical protein
MDGKGKQKNSSIVPLAFSIVIFFEIAAQAGVTQ